VVCEWRRRLPPETDFCISINLSAAALRDPSLVDHVATVLKETGTPARALKFELTESGLISNIGAAKEILERLHEMGIQLMLDDLAPGTPRSPTCSCSIRLREDRPATGEP